MPDEAAPWWVVTRDLRLIHVEGTREQAAEHGRPLRRITHDEAHEAAQRKGTVCLCGERDRRCSTCGRIFRTRVDRRTCSTKGCWSSQKVYRRKLRVG